MYTELILNLRQRDQGEEMKTTRLPETPDARSPAGAAICFLMDGAAGNLIHSTIPPRQINKATVHMTVR